MKPWQLWSGVALFSALFFYTLSPILLPFVLAAVAAYLLDPVVDKFEERSIDRGLVSAAFVGVFLAIIVAIFAVLVPVLVDQSTRFAGAAPAYAQDALRVHILPFLEQKLHLTLNRDMVMSQLSAYGEKGLNIALSILRKTALSTAAFMDILSLLLVTPLVMFYLLRDWDRIKERLETLIPRRNSKKILTVTHKIDGALSAFLRGQFAVCLAQAVFYATGLWLCGLEMGVIIGLATGMLAFIPFVGMTLGMVSAFTVAVIQFQFDSFLPYILIGGVFAAGQTLEGFVLTPKLVGDKLGLHPAWVIFALLAGGQLGGFLGVLIALPMTAIVSVLVREGITVWLQSAYYKQPAKAPAKKATRKT
ncbi:MAG: AI-2E family transporter [Proteobacteria bacterium]|nr:AI-2E family transporter [Pseudomonadota bacterium]